MMIMNLVEDRVKILVKKKRRRRKKRRKRRRKMSCKSFIYNLLN
jgi:hypothetical protein